MTTIGDSTKIRIIIDTDPGVDDIIAILLALTSPNVEVLAFIVSYGNTDREAGRKNILRTYQAIYDHIKQNPKHKSRFHALHSREKPLLALGSPAPLEGDVHSAQYFHGRDGLGDITERHPELVHDPSGGQYPDLRISDQAGVDTVLDLIRDYPERSITYVALGPLTTLALAMRKNSTVIRERIGKIVSMGGALDVPGNTTPTAEFNFYADPFAVRELLVSPDLNMRLPLDRFYLLPLDITTPHELPFIFYKNHVDPSFDSTSKPSILAGKYPLTHFTSSFLERTREIMLQYGKDAMELHDIVAIWFAVENPPSAANLSPQWKMRHRSFDIERIGELTRGMLVVDRREDTSAYAPGANRALIQEQIEKFSTVYPDYWESSAIPAQVEIDKPSTDQRCTNYGVRCVYDTPGPRILLKLLLERIWGVEM